MSETKLIDLTYVSGIENTPSDLIRRDALIEAVIKNLEKFDILYLDGESGVGKSTFLLDFAWLFPRDVISHFVIPSYQYTYTLDCILDTLYRQIFFYCNGTVLEIEETIDSQNFNSIVGLLFRKIKMNKKPLYFVLDGLHHLSHRDLEQLIEIVDVLPLGKAKFIFSGSETQLSVLFGNRTLKSKELPMLKFGIEETRQFLQDLTTDDSEVREIYRLAKKGLPEDLVIFKQVARNYDSIQDFLLDGGKDKDEILESQWESVDMKDTIQVEVLSVITFNDTPLDSIDICAILEIDSIDFERVIKDLEFIEIKDKIASYTSETYRKFAKIKLEKMESLMVSKLIRYYEENQSDHQTKFNLPDLYKRAGNWKALANFFTLDKFIEMIGYHQTLGGINERFGQALEASKKIDNQFNALQLRFTLHVSSLKDFQKYEIWESEIEALLMLDNYSTALALANSVFLKEDRLKLLAILAKQMRIKNQEHDPDLIEQIRNLYNEIDFSNIPDKGLEISGLLIYSCFDLALQMAEKISKDSGEENSMEYAFMYLSFYADEANKRSKATIADTDVINSKIKDKKVKGLATSLGFLTEGATASHIIEKAKTLDNFVQQFFLLRNWIDANKNRNDVAEVIEFALEQIIITSSDNVPNSTSLAIIAEPLPNINDEQRIHSLVAKFDSLKGIIERPTIDYVRLQLLLMRSVFQFDKEKAEDRVFDVYYLIDNLDDLSVKTDCLCILWDQILLIDPRGLIENKLSRNLSLKKMIETNVDELLLGTAIHFRIIEPLIKTCIEREFGWVCGIIEKLNTIERREHAYYTAALVLISQKDISKIDLNKIKTLLSKVTSTIDRVDILAEVIDRFVEEKDDVINHLSTLLILKPEILGIDNVARRAYVMTKLIGVLKKDENAHVEVLKELFLSLKSAWENIDIQWSKVEIGFLIAKDLAESSLNEAKEYLDLATELKNSVPFSSESIVSTYLKSTELCINAFEGLIYLRSDLSNELNKLSEIIGFVQSVGEKLKLWSEVAMLMLSKDKKDEFNKIYKDYIAPLLLKWPEINTSYKKRVIMRLAPVIYSYHHNTFTQDYLPKLSTIENKDDSLTYICDFILTKIPKEEMTEGFNKKMKLEYPDYKDLCELVSLISSDFKANQYLGFIIKSIRENRSNISKEQQGFLKQSIREIIDSKFPSPMGIKHDGYKIAAVSNLLTLEPFNQSTYDQLTVEARAIPNISDRALVLTMIADSMNASKSKGKVQLIGEAFNLIKTIPSIYDKSIRFGSIWNILLDIDKNKFTQYLKLAYQDLLSSKDGSEEGEIRNLIDMAYQHDTKLADSFVTMLDNDPARKKLKNPIMKQLEKKDKIKTARSDYKSLGSLDPEQFETVFRQNLSDLNLGKIAPKPIIQTVEIMEQASKLPLSNCFDSLNFFVKNAVRKNESSQKELSVLTSIFDATYENTKLIAILSSDNLEKMKNLHLVKSSVNMINKSPLIKAGDREVGIQYIKDWLSKTDLKKLYIIDPYFTEKDLDVIKLIVEINPDCLITILTGKSHNNNKNVAMDDPKKSTNEEVYQRSWTKISSDFVQARIRIVWDKDTEKCPFHDRWFITGDKSAGLFIGTSVNGLGSRDSQINELDPIALNNANYIVDTYILNEEVVVNDFNLKYERFDLVKD